MSLKQTRRTLGRFISRLPLVGKGAGGARDSGDLGRWRRERSGSGKARELFDEARRVEGLNAEERGLLELNDSNVDLFRGDSEEALRRLELGGVYLTRAISRFWSSGK